MCSTVYQDKLLSAAAKLSDDKIPEVIDFIEYLKIKEKLRSDEIAQFDKWAEKVAREKGFSGLNEDDVIQIILSSRKK